METTTLTLTPGALAAAFSNKTNYFGPETMQTALGGKLIVVDNEFPDFFTEQRLKTMHGNNIGMIAFVPKSGKEIAVDALNNKQANDNKLMYAIDWYKDAEFWLSEKPRTGLCLSSMGCIPGTHGMNFLKQTELLAQFVEQLIPEIKETTFWKSAIAKLVEVTPQVTKLMQKSDYKEAVTILADLDINKHFRPSFSEALQQMAVWDKVNGTRLYESDYTWTNSVLPSGEEFVYTGFFDDGGVRVRGDCPVSTWDEPGCSFLCSVEFLKTVI